MCEVCWMMHSHCDIGHLFSGFRVWGLGFTCFLRASLALSGKPRLWLSSAMRPQMRGLTAAEFAADVRAPLTERSSILSAPLSAPAPNPKS